MAVCSTSAHTALRSKLTIMSRNKKLSARALLVRQLGENLPMSCCWSLYSLPTLFLVNAGAGSSLNLLFASLCSMSCSVHGIACQKKKSQVELCSGMLSRTEYLNALNRRIRFEETFMVTFRALQLKTAKDTNRGGCHLFHYICFFCWVDLFFGSIHIFNG